MQGFPQDLGTVLMPSKWIFKSLQRPCTIVQGILPKMARREFSIFIFFPDTVHIHVLMLCRKFELIPIKFGFFTIF